MNYYNEIKNKLIDNEVYVRIKKIQKKEIKLSHILRQLNYLMKSEINMGIILQPNIQKNQQ